MFYLQYFFVLSIPAEKERARKREQTAKELREQIEKQKELLNQRKKEEQALNEAFSKLAQLELDKEQQGIKDYTAQAKREALLYRKHLRDLAEARKREEDELQVLLNNYQQEVQRKQDEAKCKIIEAKRKLHEVSCLITKLFQNFKRGSVRKPKSSMHISYPPERTAGKRGATGAQTARSGTAAERERGGERVDSNRLRKKRVPAGGERPPGKIGRSAVSRRFAQADRVQ